MSHATPSGATAAPADVHPADEEPMDGPDDVEVDGHSPNPLVRRLESVSLRARLVAILLVLLFAALTLTFSATAYLMHRDLVGRIDSELRNVAGPVAQQALVDLNRSRSARIPTSYAVIFFPTDGGGPMAVNPTGENAHPDISPLGLDDPRVLSSQPFTVHSVEGDTEWRMIAGRLSDSSATFVVGAPMTEVEHTVKRLAVVTTLIALTMLVACGVIGWYAVRRAFRPLTQIEDTASAIASGDLGRRIPTRPAGDEVTSLAESLNAMLAQIERSFAVREASEERMRQFVADASHELRTPLATVRGYAELYRQGAVQDEESVAGAMGRIEGEANRMSGLVDDLLLLARLDDERPLERRSVDLTVIGAEAVDDARVRDPERRITLVGLNGSIAPVVVTGDGARLQQVLGNLLTNALKHTREGTPVEVAVGADPASGTAVVEVRDHGRGIDPQNARRVFERFFRADKARSRSTGGGSGLGLAIVAAIVHRHGGRVGVSETPGGGATFVVHLPSGSSGNSQAASSPV